MRVLIIDNYDSFTYNLYQYVGEILSSQLKQQPFEVLVKRNDELTLDQIVALAPDRILISPGPGTPSDKAYFGVCSEVILELGKTIPLMGVCLGMQGIAYCFGGDVIRAQLPMHGKTSLIQHDGRGLYANLPQNLEIMRYHSLVVDANTLPDCLEITSSIAQNENEPLKPIEIMGLRHKVYAIEGIQYHPESFATEGGKALIQNFLFPANL